MHSSGENPKLATVGGSSPFAIVVGQESVIVSGVSGEELAVDVHGSHMAQKGEMPIYDNEWVLMAVQTWRPRSGVAAL